MQTHFPQIQNLNDILPYIKDREDIRVMEREHGYTVNYLISMPDTWSDPDVNLTEHWARRECRGLLFDFQGNLISRPYHKFFNLNEKKFTEARLVDLSQPHVILEKLDGSMIRPFNFNGEVRWATKMGETEIAKGAGAFAERNNRLMNFVRELLANNYTPIFEWCSRQQRIILDYPQDRLVLTAIRENTSGQYWQYSEMQANIPEGIDLVQAVQTSDAQQNLHQNLDEIVKCVRNLNGQEGWVIRFASGEMIKMKADEYVRQHRALEGLRWEKDVLALIMRGEVDDIRDLVSPEIVQELDQFENTVVKNLAIRAKEIRSAVDAAHSQNIDRKTFALSVVPNFSPLERSVLFRVFQGEEPMACLVDVVLRHTHSSTAVDAARYLWGGARWLGKIGNLDV